MVDVETLVAPLFVPADRPERFAKAADSGADSVILDLEDAVKPDAKEIARQFVTTDFTDLPVLLRINSVASPWHEADLETARKGGFAAVILPKAELPEAVARIVKDLSDIPVIALIETAMGLAAAAEIAASGVCRLAFGSVDYCADLGCQHQREVLLPARHSLVVASRLGGIAAPLDGVTTDVRSEEAWISDAEHARAMGMTGKLCIHPRQTTGVRQAFLPSAAELDWARRVFSAGTGAVLVDGAMVDAPVQAYARQLLQRAGELS
jgi:Citrate lyase beta subunit